MYRAQGFDGFDVHVHLALVIGSAAAVQIPVALGGLKRRRLPEFEGVGGLHIVMAVTQDRGLARGVQPVGVHQGVLIGLNHLDILESGGFQFGGYELGRSIDVGLVLGCGADAGNAEQFLQLIQHPLLMGIDVLYGLERHGGCTTILLWRAPCARGLRERAFAGGAPLMTAAGCLNR